MRLRAAGIPAPQPLHLRLHVLVMEFVGEDGVAAPRLRDAGLPLTKMRECYTDMVLIVRKLYQECRLVHADLSEYNILYHQGQLVIIDVSQAVDLDHPHALVFLREDCQHVNDFFRRQGVATLTVRELFEFAVDPAIHEGNLDAALDALMEVAASRPVGSKEDLELSDRVFQQAYIPKRLDEVVNFERDILRAQQAGGRADEGQVFYQAITGMRDDLQGPQLMPRVLEDQTRRQEADVSGPAGSGKVRGNNWPSPKHQG